MKKNTIVILTVFTIVSQLFLVGGLALRAVNAEELNPDSSVVEGTTEVVNSDPVVTEPSAPEEIITEEVAPEPAVEPVVEQTPEPIIEPTPEVTPEPVATEPVLPEILPLEEVQNLPTLTTDKADYLVGEAATIFGKIFQALQNIALKIFGGSVEEGTYTETNAEVTTDDQGAFTFLYQLDNTFRPLYTVVANALTGEELARTTFTDPAASSVNIDQCANGTLPSSLNICKKLSGNDGYTSGNVNGSKAHWQEGDFLPYRALIEAPNSGAQQVQFSFDTAKGSEMKHAIDYLSSYYLTETTGSAIATHANQADPCGDFIIGCDRQNPAAIAPIPIPSTLTSSYPLACANGSFGGSSTSGSISAWVSIGSISGLTVDVGAPANSGDCVSIMTVNFTLSNPAAKVVLAWSGHVAANNNPGSGGYWGAGNAVPTGSPYHFHAGFPQLSGGQSYNVGNQDLQLASSAIAAPSTITIIKDTVPDGPQDFGFTTTGALTPNTFNLDDDADGTLLNTQIFSVVPGTYSVTENDPSGLGYSLSGLACGTVTGTGTTATPNQGTRTVSITIGSAGGANVICTFTNTLQTGHIIVDKVTVPAANSQSFAFTTTGTGYNNFSLTDVATPNDQTLNSGTYSVAETSVTGWDLTSATCVSSIQDTETIGALELDPGETITCTFTNTKQPKLTVNKVCIPSNDLGKFNLRIDGSTAGTGADAACGGTTGAVIVTIGSHTASETAGTGTSLSDYTSVIGGDCNPSTGSVTLAAGENKVCTITNTRKGQLIVDKVTVPAHDPQSFTFTTTGAGYTGFSLTDDDLANIQKVVPGTYSVSETALAGWTLTNVTCTSGIDPSNIVLSAGQSVTCTFTNTKKGHIIVNKITDPSGDLQSFAFTTTGTGYNGFSLTDAADPNNQEVVPGAYSVAETVPAGWDLTSAICDQDETPASLDVGPGETVTCTFTDTKLGKITIVKDAQPNDCKDFNFSGTLGSFVLDDDGDATECIIDPINRDQSKTFENLAVNTSYTVNETVPNFWNLNSPIVCTGVDASQITQVANGITISLLPGNEVTCTFVNVKQGPTRTQGFWKTHTTFTESIFDGIKPMTLGTGAHTVTIDSYAKLFGAWYSDVNFETTLMPGGKKQVKRDPVEKARILLAHQLITAKLNCAAFGGCSTSINSMIASADAAYAGTDISNMNYWAGELDKFNNSGDTIIISPPLPWQGKATPKTSQSVAQTGLVFWDLP